MSRRLSITLDDARYERLRAESQRVGLGLADLVCRAVDATYGTASLSERRRALGNSFGRWQLDVDGAAYVESMRRGREGG